MKTLSPFASTLVVAALFSPALLGQGTNARLIVRVDKFPGAIPPDNNYAGIWGYVNPANGKEYAIVPARTGTIIYDCSNPATPIERGFIAGPNGGSGYFWREAASYGKYVYISSEHGPLQVINMTNPDAPTLAGSFGPTAHTVSVDEGTGALWSNGGAARGSFIYNLVTNPVNPPQIATYSLDYVHDCLPIRGFAYMAQIFSGNFRILNTKNLPQLPVLSTTTTPGNFTHNVWVSDDDNTAVTADENYGGCLTVFDVTNKSAPVKKSTWCSPSGATVHNVFIKGKVAHFSSYGDGYSAIDISNTSSPQRIAQYDTNTYTGNDYIGCWGCYPFQPSGVIYLTDMQTGFFIVEPTCGVPLLYGNGTAGTGSFVPTIDYAGGYAKVANASFQIEGTKLLGGSVAVLALGFGQSVTQVNGIEFLLDLAKPILIFAGATGGQTGVGGSGRTSIPIGIPNDAALGGLGIFAQFLVVDSGGTGGFAASRGMKVVVCK